MVIWEFENFKNFAAFFPFFKMRFYIKYQNNSSVPVYTEPLTQGEDPIVGDLVAAYKTIVAPLLDHSSVAQLTLHFPDGVARSDSGLEEDCFAPTDSTGTTLDSGCPLSSLGSLGSNSKQPLIIKSKNAMEVDSRETPSNAQGSVGSPKSLNSNQALEKFSELAGVTITDDEETILIKHFPEYVRLLKRGRLNEIVAKHLHRLIKTTLKSQTIKAVRFSHDYVFGKSIDTGGGKAILQKVFSLKTGNYLCAKVFLNAPGFVGSHSAVFEYQFSQIIGAHENIGPIVDSIQFSHESGPKDPLMALMMPLYNWSLAELLVCFQEEPLPFGLFKRIALGLLSAGAEFQSKSFSHCDIKPNNIMMNGLIPVVIDFGAVVSLGDSTVEHTPFYCLDANHDVVTSEFDLFCIVTTLVSCFAPAFELQYRTKEEMRVLIDDVCSRNGKLNDYGNICQMLLQSSSSSDGLGRIQNF
jgi:hypothetical protein